MTAVVAILNKTGMALAADSAATVSYGDSTASKVFNTANKVFTLSKHHPVSIMIYNNSEFLSTPWEIIIKLYRKQLKDRPFDTVMEYSNDFINFLESDPLLSLGNKQSEYLLKFVNSTVVEILEALKIKLLEQGEYLAHIILGEFHPSDDMPPDYIKAIAELTTYLENIIKSTSENFLRNEKLETLRDIDFESFKNENLKLLREAVNISIEHNANVINYSTSINTIVDAVIELVVLILKSNFFEFGHTGLVFVGYGDKQIYPALYAIETDGILASKLRYKVKKEVMISDENTSALEPFAQADVMNTFISGVSPRIQFIIEDSLKKSLASTLTTYNNSIIQNINGSVDEGYLNKLKSIFENEIVSTIQKDIQSYLQIAHIHPTYQALRFLSKEDLAELAESLIYLTFLKRRTTSSIENVGGAIDVAIISKGDGFIWKQRKHYFDDKLNPQFFQNYFDC